MSEDFRIVQQPGNNHSSERAFTALQNREIPKTLSDFRESAPYFELDSQLETAINTALAVGAPLLLTGEPGTGKTQVSWFLGWYFGIKVYDFQVKSTATANNLKYDFDAVAYLRDAYSSTKPNPEQLKDGETRSQPLRHQYMEKKALWLAYDDPKPSVLLIDEIDKAPRDFPNDLLQEMDKHCFQDPFSDEMIHPKSGHPPIIVITSNIERRLPDAFLRRCIYHHIELNEELIRRAVRNRCEDFPALSEQAQNAAINRFWSIREDHRQLEKKPGTAGLLVWLAVLSVRRTHAKTIETAPLNELPGIEALIKDRNDRKRLTT